MKIISVEFVNYRILKEFSYKFSETSFITVFSGDNGMGKSTVLDGIRMNLLDQYEGKLSDYLNWDAPEGSKLTNILTFEHRGIVYVSKMFVEGGSSRELTFGNEKFKNSDAVKKLAEIIDPKIFSSSVIAVQNEIDLIKTTPAERREHLKKVHDLEFFESIAKLDRELAEHQKLQQNYNLRSTILQAETFTPSPLEASSFTSRKERLSSENLADELEEEIERCKRELSVFEESSSAFLVMKKARETLSEQIEEKLLEEKDKKVEFENLDGEKENLLQKINQNFAKEDQTLQDSLRVQENLVLSFGVLQEPKAFEEDRITKASVLESSLKEEISRIEKQINLVSQGRCPECGQPFEANTLQTLQERLAKASSEKNVVTLEIEKLKEERLANSLVVMEYTTRKDLLVEAKGTIAVLSEKISSSQKSLDLRIQNLNTEMETKGKTLQKDLLNLEKDLNFLQKQLSETETQFSILDKKTDPRKEDELRIKLSRCETLLVPVSERLKKEMEIDTRNSLIIKQNKTLELARLENEKNRQDVQEQLNEIAELIRIVETSKIVLKREFPSFVISKLVKNLEMYMNDFLLQTYAGRYKVSLKESKDALLIVYGPKDADVKLASGYEKQVFSSAYRYAKELIQGFGMAILDEVDSAASDENSQLFYKTLAELPYEQIIVISHKEETRTLLEKDFGAEVIEFSFGQRIA